MKLNMALLWGSSNSVGLTSSFEIKPPRLDCYKKVCNLIYPNDGQSLADGLK